MLPILISHGNGAKHLGLCSERCGALPITRVQYQGPCLPGCADQTWLCLYDRGPHWGCQAICTTAADALALARLREAA